MLTKDVVLSIIILEFVEKIFLGNNLTRSTKNYAKILKDENLSEEEKQRILAAEKKKQEEDIIL